MNTKIIPGKEKYEIQHKRSVPGKINESLNKNPNLITRYPEINVVDYKINESLNKNRYAS